MNCRREVDLQGSQIEEHLDGEGASVNIIAQEEILSR